MYCHHLEADPRLQKEETPNEVHHVLVAAGLAAHSVHYRPIVTEPSDTAALPALPPDHDRDQPRKQLLKGGLTCKISTISFSKHCWMKILQ